MPNRKTEKILVPFGCLHKTEAMDQVPPTLCREVVVVVVGFASNADQGRNGTINFVNICSTAYRSTLFCQISMCICPSNALGEGVRSKQLLVLIDLKRPKEIEYIGWDSMNFNI